MPDRIYFDLIFMVGNLDILLKFKIVLPISCIIFSLFVPFLFPLKTGLSYFSFWIQSKHLVDCSVY